MLKFDRHIAVHASPETLWLMMKDLARNPLRYMILPTSAVVTYHPEGGLDSRINAFGFRFQERVLFDEKSRVLIFVLCRNGDWAGSRELRAESDPLNPDGARLRILWNWTPISEKAQHLDPFGFDGVIGDALVRLKTVAEEKVSNIPSVPRS